MTEDFDMPADQGTRRRGRGNRPRNRFVFCFFAAGSLVPIVLLLVLYQTPLEDMLPLYGILGGVFSTLALIVWPTCILMMDAEHAPEIISSLMIAAPLNGLWYSVVGLAIWYLRRRGNGRSGKPRPDDSSADS
jgi:hypothetical protein